MRSAIDLTSEQLTYVAIVALIAVAAIAFAGLLVRQVLAASEGTEKMQEIANAVQEGASAYLARQFRTLAIFAVVVFFLLFLLPADTTSLKIGRSIFFIVGALFSAVTGYVGMWLAVRANVRVAAAARDGRRAAGHEDRASAPAASPACSPSVSACSVRPPSC